MRRCIKLLRDAHPVQKIIKEADRNLKSQIKNLGKRHTIQHLNFLEIEREIKDNNITTPFAEFKKTLIDFPKIEREIEEEYLKEMSKHLTEAEIEELKLTYENRETEANKIKYISTLKSRPPTIPDEETPLKKPDYEISDQKNIKPEDIGKFFVANQALAKTLFLNGFFGTFIHDHYARCDKFDVMLREETLNLINMLKASQNIKGNHYPELENTSAIDHLEPLQQFEWLIKNDPKSYLSLYNKICWLMNDYVYSEENLDLYNIMRNNCDLFVSTAAILVQELVKPQLFEIITKNIPLNNHKLAINIIAESQTLAEIVKKTLNFYVSKITDIEDILKTIQFVDFVDHISSELKLEIGEHAINIPLSHYVDTNIRFSYPPQLKTDLGKVETLSAGSVLTGMRGRGKSQILSGLAMWAHSESN